MTLQIAVVLAILMLAVALFISERLRVDVVALLVLGSLALSGLITPAEAMSGFSSPAVITVWAVFILSGGLARTGVAGLIGRQMLRLAGQDEIRLLVVIMLTAGLMSAFMNNVAVTALLLPVVMDIARRTDRPASKLLMPLAFGSLLGGLTTLIGTPPNILISDILRDNGLRPFRLFDYTPVGLAVMVAGVTFMALIGRYLLPVRDLTKGFAHPNQADLDQVYHLHDRLGMIHLPPDTTLAGKTLATSRLGSALGLNVIAIIHNGQTQLSPDPNTILHPNDKLLVAGKLDQLAELHGRQHLVIEQDNLPLEQLVSTEIDLAEVSLSPGSPWLGQTVEQINFRRQYGVNVLAIWRKGDAQRLHLQHTSLQASDILLVQGSRHQLETLQVDPNFIVSRVKVADVYHLHEKLFLVGVPPKSSLVGKTLADSRLGDAFDLTVLGIVRDGLTQLLPQSSERIRAGDTLLIEGDRAALLTLHGLQNLEIAPEVSLDRHVLETDRVGLVEAILSPHTTLVGQSLRQLHFREKYELNVLAIWREGRAYRSNLRDMPLHLGDALLLYGPRDKIKILGSEPDFLVLIEEAQERPRLDKAALAVLVMTMVLLPVIFGRLPIAITAMAGATMMVVLGCLTMEEAYRSIEWKAVFLIAGMLPLGIAMEKSGAAHLLADGLVIAAGGLGPIAILAGLYVLTTLATQAMPNSAVAVLMAPIALNMAVDLGISPYAFMMTVALAASAGFLSPVVPANVLIMGPGGYRFTDYIRVGLPLTVVVLIVVLLVLPIFWPFLP